MLRALAGKSVQLEFSKNMMFPGFCFLFFRFVFNQWIFSVYGMWDLFSLHGGHMKFSLKHI